MQYYKGKSNFGLEKYFNQIDNWIDKPRSYSQKNLPLLIIGEAGVGKRTLLI